jgi:hypothetical protein
MAITYPPDCMTCEDRLGYLQRLKELIERVHNGMNKWKRDGLTLTQYNRFPNKIKNRYAYTQYLSQENWEDFNSTLLVKANNNWITKVAQVRDDCNNSERWAIDVGDAMEN